MKFGCIGYGKMGSAIIDGSINAKLFKNEDVYVFEINEEVCKNLRNQKINVCKSPDELFEKCDAVLFAIKPQDSKAVIESLKSSGNAKVIFSIMAGVPIRNLQKINPSLPIVRIMPNTCALIGESASSICYNQFVTDEIKELTHNLFNAIGKFVEIDESLMDEIIPIGGSFTAYAYLFMKAFIESSVKRGIDESVAKTLTIQSMIGSAKMVEKFGDVDTLIKNVCSKGGTTLAGLEKLYDGDFEKIIDDCAVACAERSKELGKM